MRVQEVAAQLGPQRLNLRLSYTQLSALADYPQQVSRTEVGAALAVGITENWSADLQEIRDFSNDVNILSGVGVTYRDECLSVTGSVGQSGIQIGDVKPGVSVLLTFVFKNLGEFGLTSPRSRNSRRHGTKPRRCARQMPCTQGKHGNRIVWKNVAIGLVSSLVAAAPAWAQGQAPRAHRPAAKRAGTRCRRRRKEVRIAAVVNDGVITTGDLNSRTSCCCARRAFKTRRKTAQRLAPRVLRTLIDEKLEVQEAKRLNISIDQDETRLRRWRGSKSRTICRRADSTNSSQNLGIPKSAAGRSAHRVADLEQAGRSAAGAGGQRLRRGGQRRAQGGEGERRHAAEQRGRDFPRDRQSDPGRRGAAVSPTSSSSSFIPAATSPPSRSNSRNRRRRPTAARWAGSPPAQISPDLAKAIDALKPGEVSPPVRAGGGYYILGLIDRRLPGQGNPNERSRVRGRGRRADSAQRAAGIPSAPGAGVAGDYSRAGRAVPPSPRRRTRSGCRSSREAPDIKVGTLSPGVRRIALDLQVGASQQAVSGARRRRSGDAVRTQGRGPAQGADLRRGALCHRARSISTCWRGAI